MQTNTLEQIMKRILTLLLLVLYPSICSGYTEGDINNDDRIGLQETIYSLQVVAGLTIPLSGATINVPADIPTIQEAIDAASEGDTISIAAGTYTEALTVNGKSLVLSGAGESATFLDGNGAHVITVDHSPGILIENLTVQNGDKGINIVNNSSAEIKQVTVKNCSDRGIQLWNNSNAEILDCTIENNGRDGIGALGSSNLTITGTVSTENNSRHGLMVFLGSTVLLDNATFSSSFNSSRGISLSDNSSVFAATSTISLVDNSARGIQASGSSSVGITEDSELNIEITNGAPPGTGDDGIAIADVSRIWSAATITISRMPGNGVSISGGSDFSLTGPTLIQNCGDTGFSVGRGASSYISSRLEISSCTYNGISLGQGSAIYASDTAHIIAKDTLPGGGGIGIGIYENSVLRANGGTFDITGNEEAGFDLGRNATLSLRNRGAGLDVDISGNGIGISAWQTATLRTGDGVTISNNTGSGLFLGQSSVGDIRDITIQNNGGWGIRVDNGSSIGLSDSTINTNTTGNISLSFGSRSYLSGNTITPSSLSCDNTVTSSGDLVCPST